MEGKIKEILSLGEGENIKKKELSNEDASKLLALANKSDEQESELVYLLETIDTIANAGKITYSYFIFIMLLFSLFIILFII